MGCPPREEVWTLAEHLMTGIFAAIRRIDELAPEFPDEWFEARDKTMEGLQVGDYMERLTDHSQIHRHELASVRAAIGRSWSTDPGDCERNYESGSVGLPRNGIRDLTDEKVVRDHLCP